MRKLSLLLALAILAMGFGARAEESLKHYNYREAERYLDENDHEMALYYFEREAEKHPDNVRALMMMGALYANDWEYEKAVDAFTKALDREKKDKERIALLRANRAQSYLELADTVKAIDDLKGAIKLMPKNRDFLVSLSDVYYEQARYDDAEAVYRQLAAIDPDDPYPYYGLCRSAYLQDRYAEARQHIATARELDALDVMPDRLSMRVARRCGETLEALSRAIDILSQDKNDFEALNTLNVIAETKYEQLLAVLDRVAETDADNSIEWLLIKANVQDTKEDYAGEAQTLSDIINVTPDYCDEYLASYIECCAKIDDYPLQEGALDLYIERGNNNAIAYIMLGDAHYFQGKYQESIDDFMTALDMEQDYAFICHARIGSCYEALGDYDKALGNYDTAIMLYDSDPSFYATKGWMLINRMGDEEGAACAFTLGLAADPDEESTWTAYSYAGLGDRDNAIRVIEKIIAAEPDAAGNYYDYACVLARLGDTDAAIAKLREALDHGYADFIHMEHDPDMDYLRDLPAYKTLLSKYAKPLDTPRPNMLKGK